MVRDVPGGRRRHAKVLTVMKRQPNGSGRKNKNLLLCELPPPLGATAMQRAPDPRSRRGIR